MSCIESQIDALAAAIDLPQRLARLLEGGRRVATGRSRVAPEMSYGRHAGPAPVTARAAAVMLLLFRRGTHWHLPLTVRPASLVRHGGQVSLPGGVLDAGETTSEAAVRELNEELGIDDQIEWLGRLTNCYVFASNFVITPWVTAVGGEPAWRPHEREVQGVVELPLATLINPRQLGTTTIERGPLVFHAPCLQIGPACVWGATAVILGELADVLRSIFHPRV